MRQYGRLWTEAKLGFYECYDGHFAYVVAGPPIGFMTMSGSNMTMPTYRNPHDTSSSAGCGGILVDCAITLSKSAALGGCLELLRWPAQQPI